MDSQIGQEATETAYFPHINTIYRQDESTEAQGKDNLEVSGTGILIATNTGGSSASEGGMGSGSETDTEKGELNTNTKTEKVDEDTFDPIKKNVEKAEEQQNSK